MLDYDHEAERYDATRGGDERARAAADAIGSLIPGSAVTIADVGCGTGIVTVRLAGPGRSVVGVDRSAGMASLAAARLPGRITLGDAIRLPLASGSADVVTMVWLLHLLERSDGAVALAEAGRVLRAGGVLITTVGKNDAAFRDPDSDDAAAILAPVRAEFGLVETDDTDAVLSAGGRLGLALAGRATFTGIGQGLSPRTWSERLAGNPPWATSAGPARMAALREALAALPDQDRPRADPVYQLVALRKL